MRYRDAILTIVRSNENIYTKKIKRNILLVDSLPIPDGLAPLTRNLNSLKGTLNLRFCKTKPTSTSLNIYLNRVLKISLRVYIVELRRAAYERGSPGQLAETSGSDVRAR